MEFEPGPEEGQRLGRQRRGVRAGQDGCVGSRSGEGRRVGERK